MQTKKTIRAPYEGKLHVRCDEKVEETYLRIRRLCLTLPEAITEAASRPTMRFVSPKTVEQQDIQSLHRIRSLLIQERTALSNQIKGLLMEHGIIMTKGIHNLNKCLPTIIDDPETELSTLSKNFLHDLYEQINLKTKKLMNMKN